MNLSERELRQLLNESFQAGVEKYADVVAEGMKRAAPYDNFVEISEYIDEIAAKTDLVNSPVKLEMPDTAPFQPHSVTSKNAAAMAFPKIGTQRRTVLDHLWFRGEMGCTDEQLSLHLAMTINSVRPRRVELVNAGFVKDSGRTRLTECDREATVWVANSNQLEEEYLSSQTL